MCVKLPPGDLNPDPYSPHPTSIYTYGVTITPRVCGGEVETVLINLRCEDIYSSIIGLFMKSTGCEIAFHFHFPF